MQPVQELSPSLDLGLGKVSPHVGYAPTDPVLRDLRMHLTDRRYNLFQDSRRPERPVQSLIGDAQQAVCQRHGNKDACVQQSCVSRHPSLFPGEGVRQVLARGTQSGRIVSRRLLAQSEFLGPFT